MFFHLEEITLGDSRYLTELTWRWGENGKFTSSHYPVRHPGSADTDDLIAQIQPDYTPPYRYLDKVVLMAFLVDYQTRPANTPIFGGSVEQLRALQQYLAGVPMDDRGYVKMFRPLQDYFEVDACALILSELAKVRQDVMRSRG